MKTIQELYNEVMANEELKAQVIEAGKAGKLDAFLREHGCEATKEEVAAFLKEKANEDRPLSQNELENAAGGKCTVGTGIEVIYSTLTIGVGCIMAHIVSGHEDGKGTLHKGQIDDNDGRICNIN